MGQRVNVVVRRGRRGVWLLAFVAAVLCAVPGVASARAHRTQKGRIAFAVTGLPPYERAAFLVQGRGIRKLVRADQGTLRLPAGTYTITLRQVRASRSWNDVLAGARMIPRTARVRVRVRRGRTSRLGLAYTTIVNPGVQSVPRGLLGVTGVASSPDGLIYGPAGRLPGPGAILIAPQSSLLPEGLVARVTGVQSAAGERILLVAAVPVTTAVPEFSYSGSSKLTPARDQRGARAASDDSPCKVSAFHYGATLNQFEIRHASARLWPPQLSFTLAARTTERFQVDAGADLSCDWTLATLGPWRGVIPTPVVEIPVYAQIPITASADLAGSVGSLGLNVASTHVLTLDLGHQNDVHFEEQGANVWEDQSSQGSASASLTIGAALEFGIGDPKLGNLHADLGFSTTASLSTDGGCAIDVNLGSLSAGVQLGPFSASTPSWTPFVWHLWHGCGGLKASGGGGTPGLSTTGGPGGPGGPTGPTTGGAGPSGGGGVGLPPREFTVMNASGGVYWRSSPDWNAAQAVSGNGFYPGTVIAVSCYQSGAANVPGSAESMWEQATWAGGPGRGAGWINEHFIDDGAALNQPSPGVPPCSSSGGGGPSGGSGGGVTTPPPSGSTPETVGGVTHTWTNYTNAGGTQGPSIQTGQTVGVVCKVQGFRVADGDTWWYKIASSPWSGQYYASADAFYNNGQTSGSLAGTPFVDGNVPDCGSPQQPPPPPPTWNETVGGVTHTWTNYTNAGGTQGPSIQTSQTVQVYCKVQGFRVADGDTWWYKIASSPWSGQYYASADAFYNNGQTSGSLHGTPFVDNAVANC